MLIVLSDQFVFALYSAIMVIIGMVAGYMICKRDQAEIRKRVFKK